LAFFAKVCAFENSEQSESRKFMLPKKSFSMFDDLNDGV